MSRPFVIEGQRYPFRRIFFWGLALLLVLLLGSCSIATIEAGHVGVLTLFGKVDPQPIYEGIHLINPLKRVHQISVRTQELFEHADVPSKEGLSVALEVSALFHVVPEKAPEIFRSIGPNYRDTVLVPQFRSEIRGVTVRFEAKDLYTSGRELIANQIYNDLSKMYAERGFVLEKVLLRKIVLPPTIQQAINEKLAAEQDAERMRFILAKEKQEAERKRVEAAGIADFQRIVAQGISEQLLRWKGIEATQKLAESSNAKVVVIGSGKDGLPLILGSQ